MHPAAKSYNYNYAVSLPPALHPYARCEKLKSLYSVDPCVLRT